MCGKKSGLVGEDAGRELCRRSFWGEKGRGVGAVATGGDDVSGSCSESYGCWRRRGDSVSLFGVLWVLEEERRLSQSVRSPVGAGGGEETQPGYILPINNPSHYPDGRPRRRPMNGLDDKQYRRDWSRGWSLSECETSSPEYWRIAVGVRAQSSGEPDRLIVCLVS
ncbi:hypothetical protein NHX12_002276 [Muraenolepis orangiensis]|uniref:Uncharacterized protein n=1 Tax=Muraenolepis orangiensis TaxID=630683 RepID=A0A9Q0DU45_9TELE|nr:hypothetical protein NHX12_002276 [Muraenolepis orangiensis]